MALQIYGAGGGRRQQAAPLSISAEISRDDAWAALATSGDEGKARTICELAQRGEAELANFLDLIVATLAQFPPPRVKAAVCQAVRSAGAAGALYAQEVAELLGDQDAEVKYQACLALASMGPSAAGAALGSLPFLLGDTSETVRYGACAALGALEASACVEEVAALLTDSSPEVQGAACWALGKMGRAGRSSAAAVAKRLAEPRCRLQALRALTLMGAECAPVGCEDVCDCLGDEDAETRMAAAAAVGEMAKAVRASDPAFGKVSGFLHGQDGRFRISAAMALGNMGQHAADQTDSLKDMLDDEFAEPAVNALTVGGCRPRLPATWRKSKCAAAAALGRIAALSTDGCDVGQLAGDMARLLDVEDWEVRLTACEALANMGVRARSHATKVVDLFQDSRYVVRAKAAAACGSLCDPDTATSLADLLEDKAPTVREEAVRALALLGEEGGEHIEKVHARLVDSTPAVRAAAIAALAAMGERGQLCASAVAQRLADEQEVPVVRLAAIEALGKMEERGAVYADLVAEYAQDPLPQLREAAQRSLARMGGDAEVAAAGGAAKGLMQLETGEEE